MSNTKQIFIEKGRIPKIKWREWTQRKPTFIRLSSVKAIESLEEKDNNIYVHFEPFTTKRIAQKSGILYVIGYNGRGQFGLGDDENRESLTRCKWSENRGIIDISAGYGHTIYQSQNGEYYACGSNKYGQCALNDNKEERIKICRKIDHFEKNDEIVMNPFVSPVSDHMFWITKNGKLYGNGRNTSGELGIGNQINRYSPSEIKYFRNKGLKIISVALADKYSSVLCEDGNVYTSGTSEEGGLGHGNNKNKTREWREVEALRDHTIIQIVNGKTFSLLVEDNGSVWICGSIKGGNDNSIKIPTKIQYFEQHNIKIVRVAAAYQNALALDDNGKVYSWGKNEYAECGDGTRNPRDIPILIPTLKDKIIMDVQCGRFHCAAITDKNKVYLWGYNGSNECCNDKTRGSYQTKPECINEWVAGNTNGGSILSVSLGCQNTYLLIDECGDNKALKEETKEEISEISPFKIKYVGTDSKWHRVSLPIKIPKSSIPTSFSITFGESIPSKLISIQYKRIKTTVNYIHNDEDVINIEFVVIHTNFNQFKKLIFDKLESADIDTSRLGIAAVHSDNNDNINDSDNNQMVIINEDSFNRIISEISDDCMLSVVAGLIPEIPQIKGINNDIIGELHIKLQSKYADRYYLDIESEEKEIITTNPTAIIKNINYFSEYKIRVRSSNKFGESVFSEWRVYNYKECVSLNKHSSLNQFEVNDICDIIKKWIFTDINYKTDLVKIEEIFNEIDGEKISVLTGDNIKSMVKKELLSIMSERSIKISFDCFVEWKNNKQNDINSKDVALMIYHFPLFELIKALKDGSKNECKFVMDSAKNKEFIQGLTGWNEEKIDQIQILVFKYNTFTKDQFNHNLDQILSEKQEEKEKDGQLLPDKVINDIKTVINEFNVENICYDIKNGRKNYKFSDQIINFIGDLIGNNNEMHFGEDFIKRIYEFIADCFVFDDNKNNKNKISAIHGPYNWRCINCGNYNHNKQIGNEMMTDSSICNLCGITKKEGIIQNIKNHETYLMVNKYDDISAEETRDDTVTFKIYINNKYEDISKLIKVNQNELMIYYIGKYIKSAFNEMISWDDKKKEYELKLYVWDKRRAKVEIKNDKELRDIIYNKTDLLSLSDLNEEEMGNLVESICVKQDKLNKYKELFIEWFSKNKINGAIFMKIIRKEFGESIIKYYDNNKKLRGPSMALFKELYSYKVEENNDDYVRLRAVLIKRTKKQSHFIQITQILPDTFTIRLQSLDPLNVNSKNSESMDKTVKVDISASIDNKTYKFVLFESYKANEKITEKDMNLLEIMFNENPNDIQNVKTFLLNRKQFIQTIKAKTKITPAVSTKVYKVILNKLKKKAQTEQFDTKFLSEYDIKGTQNLNKLDVIAIAKNEQFATKNVDFVMDDDGDIDEIAVYDQQNEPDEPISNTIKLARFPDSSSYPPNTENYRPQTVDRLSIKQILDKKNKQIVLWWNVPIKSYGTISYKVIYDSLNEEKHNDEIVSILPYCIPFNLIPIKIGIITISTFNEKPPFYSEPLEITIDAEKKDDIDDMIETVLSSGSFEIYCPNAIDTKMPCPAIIRLTKNLIHYKRWLSTVYSKSGGNDSIDQTVKVDISASIDNKTYKSVLFESFKSHKKIKEKDMNLLDKMFHENPNDIQSVKSFLKMKRQQFAQTITANLNIKRAIPGQVYTVILKKLKEKAQTKQFDSKFLSDLDIETITTDYHHILNSHINNGDTTTIRNTVQFFTKMIHFEDQPSEIKKCRSAKRKQQRMDVMDIKNTKTEKEKKEEMNVMHTAQSKDIWELKQIYIQSELDKIHSFLAHSKWEYFVKRHVTKHQEQSDDEEMDASDGSTGNALQNQGKYMSESSESSVGKYGFGLAYSYPHLSPIYSSIFDELYFNTLYPLKQKDITDLLVKAIKLHGVALSDEYNKVLICKYYDPKFNIIRSEPIGIIHIFSIVTYTDMSKFCTAFRGTYRAPNNEKHLQLYNYSRSLFEAVEFFGEYMDSKMKVFHGLNKIMFFERFSAYFNQPISTTPSKKTAHEFSGGVGIILTLKSASNDMNNDKEIPKFLSVSWLSNFPNEEEKLFYGEHVHFRIHDIIEADNIKKKHDKELFMMDKFQKTVQNEHVEWNDDSKENKNMIKALTILIEQQQNKNSKSYDGNNPYLDPNITESFTAFSPPQNKTFETKFKVSSTKKVKTTQSIDDEKTEEKMSDIQISSKIKKIYMTDYGQKLFDYFCNNMNRTWIAIKNYKSMTTDLKDALFGDKKQISLCPLTKLFINLNEITLNEIDIEEMTVDSKEYVKIVLDYINSQKMYGIKLKKISFKSNSQQKHKENPILKAVISSKHSKKLIECGWQIKYEYETADTHDLLFINNQIQTKQSKGKTADDKVEKLDLNVFKRKQNEIPAYFIQITCIEDDYFHVDVICNKSSNKKRKLFIKDINIMDNKEELKIVGVIIIGKNKMSAANDVVIYTAHNELYHLAVFDNKYSRNPIPNSNQIRLSVLKDSSKYPPQNMDYRPKCVEIESITECRNEDNNKLNIYWSIPAHSFGDITYKLITGNDESKDQESVSSLQSLPYEVPLTTIPFSFKIITVSIINDKIYESHPSEIITVGFIGNKNEIETDNNTKDTNY